MSIRCYRQKGLFADLHSCCTHVQQQLNTLLCSVGPKGWFVHWVTCTALHYVQGLRSSLEYTKLQQAQEGWGFVRVAGHPEPASHRTRTFLSFSFTWHLPGTHLRSYPTSYSTANGWVAVHQLEQGNAHSWEAAAPGFLLSCFLFSLTSFFQSTIGRTHRPNQKLESQSLKSSGRGISSHPHTYGAAALSVWGGCFTWMAEETVYIPWVPPWDEPDDGSPCLCPVHC